MRTGEVPRGATLTLPRSRGVWALFVAALMQVAAAVHVGAQPQVQFPPETSWSLDSARYEANMRLLGGEMRRLLSMKWSIPEYHDEQAFPLWPLGMPASDATSGPGLTTGTLAVYGPIVHMYASPYLGDFRFRWQIREQGPRGMLAAVVLVRGNGPLPTPYTELGLRRGINCLWLALPQNAGPWRGYVSPAQDGECTRNLPTAQFRELRVVASPREAFDDVPPVARISFATNGQPLLGTKCIDQWCEFGPVPGAFDPAWVSEPPLDPAGPRERRIKGWYDDQWLSVRENGRLRPRVRAAIVPVPNLDRHQDSAFSTPRHVGEIHVFGDPPETTKYFKWGLRRGVNNVYLQWHMPTGAWYMGFAAPGEAAPTTWIHAARMTHHDAAVPGTSRWRWMVQDDGMWYPCGDACCRSASGGG